MLDHSLSSELVKYLDSSDSSLRERYRRSGIMVDRFGKPYRLAVTVETSAEAGDQFETLVIAVWSTGKNGVDENGRGDDSIRGPVRYLAPRVKSAKSSPSN